MAKSKKTAVVEDTPQIEETFPSWRYGPNGESQICQSADDVPEGWEDHPAKVVEEEGEPEALDL